MNVKRITVLARYEAEPWFENADDPRVGWTLRISYLDRLGIDDKWLPRVVRSEILDPTGNVIEVADKEKPEGSPLTDAVRESQAKLKRWGKTAPISADWIAGFLAGQRNPFRG